MPSPAVVAAMIVTALSGRAIMTTGKTFYVGNRVTTIAADTIKNGQSPLSPFSTLDYAIGQCTASRGDVIYVMPGHAESLGAAAAIACDVAGISIIGLGNGSNRPTFTWHTTDATWTVSAANVLIQNIRTTVDLDEIVSMFSVTAANVTFDAVDFVEGTSAQAIQFMLTTAAADYLTIKNCRHVQLTAAGSAQKWIQLVGVDSARIVDNTFQILANASTSSNLISGSTALVYCEIGRNIMHFAGATITIVVNLVTGSTGSIYDNRLASGTSVATAAAITGDACFMWNNLWADTAAASGLLAPVVDTDT